MSQTPAVTAKQLIKILESRDWYVKRVRGSHHILRHPIVPDAVPVKRGTLGNILSAAQISRKEFQRLLQQAHDPPSAWQTRGRHCHQTVT